MNIILASYQEMNRNRMRTKMRGETNKSQTRQRPEQGRPQGGLKMRPMRVKVRKQFPLLKTQVVKLANMPHHAKFLKSLALIRILNIFAVDAFMSVLFKSKI